MTGQPDTWGSPLFVMFNATIESAEQSWQIYERNGDPAALAHAIEGCRLVLDLAVNVDVRSAAANMLGLALWSRFERFGRQGDLDEAVELFTAALAYYLNEETEAKSSFYANLSAVLALRWKSTRRDADLDGAIGAVRAALARTAMLDARRFSRMSSLAIILTDFYVQHNDSSALDEAVSLLREAVDGATGPALTYARSNLAEALRLRYHAVRGDSGVLDEAIDHARAALADARQDPLLRYRFESNLARLLHERYLVSDHPDDRDEAIALAESAVRGTPLGHPNRIERLANLAHLRSAELMRVWDLPVLEPHRVAAEFADREVALGGRDATSNGLRARLRAAARRNSGNSVLRALRQTTGAVLSEVPPGHVLYPQVVLDHARALACTAIADSDTTAHAEALGLYRTLARNRGVAPDRRIFAARRWASLEMSAPDDGTPGSVAAMPAFDCAVDLLPLAISPRMPYADRARALAELSGLTRDAAACSIQAGLPRRALEMLERGRGVLLSQSLDARADLTDLHDRHPDIARRFDEVRSALDSPQAPGFTASGSGPGLAGEQRHVLATEFERLLETIRRLPEFERFLTSPDIETLIGALPDRGPVAVINVSPFRCDALLIAGGTVESVSLDLLNYADLARNADRFRSAVGMAENHRLSEELRRSARQTMHDVLEWLWDAVAEPVLTAAGFDEPIAETRTPQRIWWVPTGPLSTLPLHAAGSRSVPGDNVLDRVISSYAPTVRSLATRRLPVSGAAPLIVGLPETPGFPELPSVHTETAAILDLYPDTRILTGPSAINAAVLEALAAHAWVHFACHAVSSPDLADPGRIVLHDHDTHPLTVADIARLRLDRADLAYLSACETGVPHEALYDEALHITGACRMAGFRHVIGTLWPVRDSQAAAIATDFYTALRGDSDNAAAAMHFALSARREQYRDAPGLWAAHIHVGP